MASNSTQPTDASVGEFLGALEPQRRRSDAQALDRILSDVTGEPPVLWGSSIIGYGNKHYRYETGREGDWFLIGFSSRASKLVVYFTTDHDPELVARLGKHTSGVGCMYINKLGDVDVAVLQQLIEQSVSKACAS